MGLFDLFKKKQDSYPDMEQMRIDKLWNMWSDGKVESPYRELMNYQSEINNGGHDQYFFNVENTGDLKAELSALRCILPPILKDNLDRAYEAFIAIDENDGNEEAEEVLESCNGVFYENEEAVNLILEAFAEKI